MRIIAAVTVIGLCLIATEQASACSCAGPTQDQSIEEFIRERAKTSDGVIVGKLLRVEEHDEGGTGFGAATFTYLIRQSYKHEQRLRPGRSIRIESSLMPGVCPAVAQNVTR